MFEQTFVNTYAPTRRPWTFMASAALQSMVLAAIVLLTLMHTDGIPSRLSRLGGGLPFVSVAKTPVTQSSSATRAPVRSSRRTLFVPVTNRPLQTQTTIDEGVFSDASDARGVDQSGLLAGSGPPGHLIGGPPLAPPPASPRPKPPAASAKTPATLPSPKPVPVSTGVQSAKLINQIKPAYPPHARAARISGTVRLEAIISKDGAIQNLRSIIGHPFLVQAAMDAVRRWRYHPTLLNDVPVEVITQIEVNFTLTN
ncbi:MAG: energy transducer TonB [Bryobacteraceae bacterium]